MKRAFLSLILVPALTAALAVSGAAQTAIHPGGWLRVDGDSSLHKWSSTATVVAMTFQPADGASPSLAEAIKGSKIKGLEVKVGVAGLKSGESGLDRNLRKAMKEKEFPEVVYRLESYTLTKGAGDGALSAKTQGQLTIAGQTKPISMEVALRMGPDGPEASGHYTLKMSDFGVKPPTLMLGTIKTRDPVTIAFDLLLAPKEKAP